jgi:hypothetical protein
MCLFGKYFFKTAILLCWSCSCCATLEQCAAVLEPSCRLPQGRADKYTLVTPKGSSQSAGKSLVHALAHVQALQTRVVPC